ncbi:MAG: pantoate--beta-alanine ligase [Propionibacteriaceae bacterium]
MRVARTIAELSDLRDELTAGQPRPTVAFVPTMGALHAGHLSLFRIARNVADVVVVSIFVNPLQFGPDEDYARYPRVLEEDLQTCRDEDIDIVFAPTVTELYPAGRQVTVSAGHLGTLWEGRSRPGHFDGVLTVVSKLLNIVRPDKAIFGQKDAQQLAVIRKMASDLNIDVDIVAAPTIREEDGLALSSRNRYLLPHERKSALAIWHALAAATREDNAAAALAAAQDVIDLAECDSAFRLDYLAWVNPHTFAELSRDHEGDGLLIVSARVGDTRLMDNVELSFSRPALEPDEADGNLSSMDTRVSF